MCRLVSANRSQKNTLKLHTRSYTGVIQLFSVSVTWCCTTCCHISNQLVHIIKVKTGLKNSDCKKRYKHAHNNVPKIYNKGAIKTLRIVRNELLGVSS